MTANQYRTDPVPAVNLRGFDKAQNVFLYDAANAPSREAALFFPLECYYPDDAASKEASLDEILAAHQAYDAYVASLDEGHGADIEHPAMKAYAELAKQMRTTRYFGLVRSLFDQLLDGRSPDAVFESNTPDLNDEDEWADYKSAYFDATGLLTMLAQVDMPRMAAAGGFSKFAQGASEDQRLTMERFAHPERFDAQGAFIEE